MQRSDGHSIVEGGRSSVSLTWTRVDVLLFLESGQKLTLAHSSRCRFSSCSALSSHLCSLLFCTGYICTYHLEEYSALVSRCTKHSVVCVVLFPNSMRIWRGGTICGNGRKDEGIAFHPTVRTLNTVSAPTALGRGSVLSPLGTATTILDAHCFTHF